MTSDAPSRPDRTVRAVVEPQPIGSRLTLKPAGAAKGHFDGGWWPSSEEVVAEFSALVVALMERLGSVNRIGFCLSCWAAAPDCLVVRDRTVRLHGFRDLNAHTIILIGPHVPRLTLLIVPAGASPRAARTALKLAARADNTGSATHIFAASGILRSDQKCW